MDEEHYSYASKMIDMANPPGDLDREIGPLEAVSRSPISQITYISDVRPQEEFTM